MSFAPPPPESKLEPHRTKGQLISEWKYEDIVSPKKNTKNCKDFCPMSEAAL